MPAHELGRDQDRRVVDRDRGEKRSTPDRREPLARRDLTGRVVREPGREIERDRVGTAALDDPVEPGGEVGEELVPGHVASVHAREVEAAGRMVPRREPTPLRTHVAARHGVVFVAAYAHDAVALDGHDDSARRRADPAVGELVARHDRTLGPRSLRGVLRRMPAGYFTAVTVDVPRIRPAGPTAWTSTTRRAAAGYSHRGLESRSGERANGL